MKKVPLWIKTGIGFWGIVLAFVLIILIKFRYYTDYVGTDPFTAVYFVGAHYFAYLAFFGMLTYFVIGGIVSFIVRSVKSRKINQSKNIKELP